MDVRSGWLLWFAAHRQGWCALLAALVPALPAPAAEPLTVSGRALGTTWSAKWLPPAGNSLPDAAALRARLAAHLEVLERQFSTYRPDSELSRFNRFRDQAWFAVSPALARVATQAREISATTGGAFDVTVAPLLELWGIGPRGVRPTWPTDAELAGARARVGWRQLEARLDPPALRKTAPGVEADFSSIAKGYAVDELCRQLGELGVSNQLVQIGGDLRAAGPGPEGSGWRVAIENPLLPSQAIVRVLLLRDQAISTSGSYRNQVTLGGRLVGHLVDPRTGRPAGGPLAAVSVVAHDCATSSALATGLFVLGAEAGLTLATRERIAALFLVGAGETVRPQATPSFDSLAP